MLARDLNIDFVNLGFSGFGKGDLPVARAMASLDASCYVLDYGANNPTPENMEEVYLPFIKEIRKVKKDTPIVLVTPILSSNEAWEENFKKRKDGLRDVVRKAYKEYIDSGDSNIYLIEGLDLISFEDSDGIVDNNHPNDIGFLKMSNRLGKVLRGILKIT
jgi:hypothetical protein